MTVDTLPTAEIGARSQAAPAPMGKIRRLLHEPLVHFLALGGALFLFNALLSPSVPADRKIEFTAEDRRTIVEAFVGERKREPTTEELDYLINTWLLNEITYREALAQGLDKGDEMIRERLMQKMRILIFSNLPIENPTEAELQQWLEVNRARFSVPERVTFSDLLFTGPAAQAEAQSAATALETGTAEELLRLRVRHFAERPRPTLSGVFGADFAERLAASTPGHWQAFQTDAGWHAVKLEEVAPGKPAELEEIRGQVIEDWKANTGRARAIQAVRDMGKRYVIQGVKAQ